MDLHGEFVHSNVDGPVQSHVCNRSALSALGMHLPAESWITMETNTRGQLIFCSVVKPWAWTTKYTY